MIPGGAGGRRPLHAIFDWGGGTLDVAVVEWQGDRFRVRASHGVDPLGGEDIDPALLVDVFGQLEESTRGRIRAGSEPGDRGTYHFMRISAGRGRLSSDSQTPVYAGTKSVVVTRDRLDELAGPFVERCIDALRTCLAQAEVKPGGLAGLHLTGDASRMPLVGARLRAFTGMDLRLPPDPKAVVSRWEPSPTPAPSTPTAQPRPVHAAKRATVGACGAASTSNRSAWAEPPVRPRRRRWQRPAPSWSKSTPKLSYSDASSIVVPERRPQLTRDVDTNARYASPDGTVAMYQVLSQSDGTAGATPALTAKWRRRTHHLGWGPSQEQQVLVNGLSAVTWKVTRPNHDSSTPDQIVLTTLAGWTTCIMISGPQAAGPAAMWQSVLADVDDKDWLRHRLLPTALPSRIRADRPTGQRQAPPGRRDRGVTRRLRRG